MSLSINQIAEICHEANRNYCAALGDSSHLTWGAAPEWQCDSARSGVQIRLDNPGAPGDGPSTQHEAWLADKLAAGWVYGEEKNAEAKTHPCCVPFDELPTEQQLKDALFVGIVEALRPLALRAEEG